MFRPFFKPLIIVTNQPRDYLLGEEMLVTDLVDLRSSLTGIYSGLFHTPASHAFVTGGDMPYLQKELVALLLEYLEPRWDVIVPVTAAGYQPLVAIYSRRCLPLIARQLAQKRCKILDDFPRGPGERDRRNPLREWIPNCVPSSTSTPRTTWRACRPNPARLTRAKKVK